MLQMNGGRERRSSQEGEEAKARATAGKCHDSIISVNMITADVGVMGLHHC